MKRHFYFLVGLAILVLGLASCSGDKTTDTIILAHSLPTSHPVHHALQFFADEVGRLSSDELYVKVYPNSQLGSEREVLELVQIGSVGITKVSAGAMANFTPKYRVLGIPYLFQDEDHAWEVLEGEIGQEILDSGTEYMLKGLTFYDAGTRSFYTKSKPIRNAEDVKGMKLRVMDDPLAVEMVRLLGGSATPMSFGELYTALQQGVVDGAENNSPSVVSSNHFEVCNYYSLNRHTMLPDVLVIGTRVWNNLTEQQQEWVQEAALTSLEEEKKLWNAAVEEDMIFLEEQGMEIIEPDIESFRQATEPLKDKLRDDKRIGDLIRRIEEISS